MNAVGVTAPTFFGSEPVVCWLCAGCLVTGLVWPVSACIWDADTMFQERITSPKLAQVILGKPPPQLPDATPLRKRIATLKANPNDTDPNWWNNLAGTHLRLGEAVEAVKLLESVTNRFPRDYGIHANLGTAYHVLGRFQDAEREIARDLEINPEAHFGLEKFHLALLQYLSKNKEYQRRHLYVDEFTATFLRNTGTIMLPPDNGMAAAVDPNAASSESVVQLEAELKKLQGDDAPTVSQRAAILHNLAQHDPSPNYRLKWNLAVDPKLEAGLIYMAALNSNEPACFAMLGVKSLRNHDLNLAAAAFERAINLGSPHADLLQARVTAIRRHITEARRIMIPYFALAAVALTAIGLYVVQLIRRRRTRLAQLEP